MTTLSPQYTAGLIDGEGTIVISPRLNRGLKQFVNEICVQMADREVIEAMVCTWGGGFREVPKQAGHKTQYRWRVFGDNLIGVLDAVEPFLIVKRQQALQMRRFIATRNSRINPKRTTSDELAALQACYEGMRFLNRRGEDVAA